ncbi:MAG TPA: TlpA disulfide reductase family protein, partial [Phycisphaerales bacterium]|nr:TlpA disulfide reductase family protein [Phycisphaerales bacterium]
SEDAPADHIGLYLLEPYFINGTTPSIPSSDSSMTATLGKSEDIDGVTCHHIIIKQKIDPDTDAADKSAPASTPLYATIHEYFAASDFLLRKRISEIPPLHAGSAATDGPITRTFTITNLKTNPDIDQSVFNPEIPEGYAERKPDGLDSILDNAKLRIGDVAPDWDAKDPSGNTHTLSQYKGKVVLMDFWATWCGPCKAAMPGIQKLYDKFKDQDFVAFGLSVNDNGDPAAYMKSKNYTYTCLLNGENVIGPYGVGPLPQFFLIGRDGKVLYHAAGYDEKQEEKLSSIIQSALDAK